MSSNAKAQGASRNQLAYRIWRNVGRPLFIILIFTWTIRLTLADWRDVPSGSMEPTIATGDRILVNLIAYEFKVPFTSWTLGQWSTPKRGDVIVFRTDDNFRSMVKRVIGMPGETIEVRDGVVYINGSAATYQTNTNPARFSETRDPKGKNGETRIAIEKIGEHQHVVMFDVNPLPSLNFPPLLIPDGEYFVMGDNRDNSYDSRGLGCIKQSQIIGKVYSVAFSLDVDHGYKLRNERWFQPVK